MLQTCFRSMSKYLIIGIGQSYVLCPGNIDLSIGSVVRHERHGSSNPYDPWGQSHGCHTDYLVCCLAIGVKRYSGRKVPAPPFIATLGTMFAARGVAYMVNNNRNTDAIATGIGKEAGDSFQNLFYYGKTFGIYNTFWIALILFLIFFFLLSRTRTGRHIYAIGSNVEAAKLSGVDVVTTTIKAYLVSATCACVVGLILCAQAGMGKYGSRAIWRDGPQWCWRHRRYLPLGGTESCWGPRCGCMADPENGLNMIGVQVGIQRLVIGIGYREPAVLLDVVFWKRNAHTETSGSGKRFRNFSGIRRHVSFP